MARGSALDVSLNHPTNSEPIGESPDLVSVTINKNSENLTLFSFRILEFKYFNKSIYLNLPNAIRATFINASNAIREVILDSPLSRSTKVIGISSIFCFSL